MPSEQGNGTNKVDTKRLCVYAMFTAACLVASYIESLLPLAFIAPGIKLGLSNSVALCLAFSGDKKGAFAVNTARILLSALLFGSAVSFVFAIAAGTASLLAVCFVSRFKSVSAAGGSVLGGVTHNIVQCAVAAAISGTGVFYYLPVLIAAGAVSGGAVGAVCLLVLKKIKTNPK